MPPVLLQKTNCQQVIGRLLGLEHGIELLPRGGVVFCVERNEMQDRKQATNQSTPTHVSAKAF